MRLPTSWTTVTPLSKTIALIIFAVLPFLGFFMGVRYQQRIDEPLLYAVQKNDVDVSQSPSLATYDNNVFHFSFQYPAELIKTEAQDHTSVEFNTSPPADRTGFSLTIEKTTLPPSAWWTQVGQRKYQGFFNKYINSIAISAHTTPYSELKGIEVIGQRKSPGGATFSSSVYIVDAGEHLFIFESNDATIEEHIFSTFTLKK